MKKKKSLKQKCIEKGIDPESAYVVMCLTNEDLKKAGKNEGPE